MADVLADYFMGVHHLTCDLGDKDTEKIVIKRTVIYKKVIAIQRL